MIAGLLLLIGAFSNGQDEYSDVLDALAGNDVRTAHRIVESASGLEGHRARTELAYRTRDFEGALAAGRAGLREHPEDLILLHRAFQSAVWLRWTEIAKQLAERFDARLAAAELDAEQRAWWTAEAAGLAEELDLLERREASRRAAETRGRIVALLGLTLTAAALLALGLAPAGARAD